MGDAELRSLLHLTAGVSAVCFTVAFAAPAAASLFPRFGEALLRRRAILLLALAASHTLHLVFVVERVRSGGFRLPSATMWAITAIGGGLAYVVIYALAARAVWPERMLWIRRLHAEGASWWVWFVFLTGFLGRARTSYWRGALVVALLVAAVLRVAARYRRPERRVRAAAGD